MADETAAKQLRSILFRLAKYPLAPIVLGLILGPILKGGRHVTGGPNLKVSDALGVSLT